MKCRQFYSISMGPYGQNNTNWMETIIERHLFSFWLFIFFLFLFHLCVFEAEGKREKILLLVPPFPSSKPDHVKILPGECWRNPRWKCSAPLVPRLHPHPQIRNCSAFSMAFKDLIRPPPPFLPQAKLDLTTVYSDFHWQITEGGQEQRF